ncbi:MAG TPA: CPBP family intramembrane glutamic endopeptidase [Patescibacteria group bacterium]|nr:CPBP family intramembrane glutamic endopeptidase [Patescibacteria group bacterium]
MTHAPPDPRSGDRLASDLRAFGPLGQVAMLVIVLSGTITPAGIAVPLGALLALAWCRWSLTPWRAIGYVRPRSWIGGLAAGTAVGAGLKLLMKAIVMPLLGADPTNGAYRHLAGNRALLPAAIWMMLVAGFGEETVFRGFLFERLGKILGSTRGARVAILLITSALFGLAHYADQGLAGAEQGLMTGLAFGAIFAVTGGIWVPICAHAAFDLTALAIIYLDLESAVAHLVFKGTP